MGSSVTIVTAIAFMAPGYTVYCPPVQSLYPFYVQSPLYVVCSQQSLLLNGGSFTYTGVLQGAVFGFVFENAVQDGDSDSIYNITSGNSGTALATCTTSNTTNTCSTPVTFVLTGNPYELETFASSENNYTSGTADSAYNYTIVVLPPVPAQPSMYSQYSNNVSTGSLILTTSQWSAEYASNMTGCLLHYGQTPYQPSNVPQLLTSSTPATSLPAASVTYFSVNQNASMTVSPASFSNAPVSMVGYDYHFICYNGNGASPEVILYNITVNSGKFSNSATSSYSTSNIVSLMIGVLGVACSAILFG